MIILDNIVQLNKDWFNEKLGKPSASKMDRILTPSGKPSTQAKTYLYELCAERITGKYANTYKSQLMEEGLRREGESRLLYELINGVEVEQVGIIYQNNEKKFLCSPDGLINRQHGLELKNVLPKTQVAYLLNGQLPNEYFVQVQASMMITGFSRWAFFSYSPGLPPLDLMIPRNDYFCAALKVELEAFCQELDKVTEQLRKLQ